jgi:hypothetical protein
MRSRAGLWLFVGTEAPRARRVGSHKNGEEQECERCLVRTEPSAVVQQGWLTRTLRAGAGLRHVPPDEEARRCWRAVRGPRAGRRAARMDYGLTSSRAGRSVRSKEEDKKRLKAKRDAKRAALGAQPRDFHARGSAGRR